MPPDLYAIAALLARDVARTLGPAHQPVIEAAAQAVRTLEIADPGAKLVEDVQQVFHDTFVDTTWPACPRHHTHPLEYADGLWWCVPDHAPVASLGELSASSPPLR